MQYRKILLEEFIKPLGLSQNLLARQIGVSPRRINEIVNGKRSITADTAYRLSRRFGTSEKFWMNLQAGFELDSIDMEHRETISGEVISVSKEEVKKLNLG